MKFMPINPPRTFEVGRGKSIKIKDCARIELAPDEQITFLTDLGAEYDVVRKDWGFYATPSLSGRLSGFGLRAALVKSTINKFYIFLVENSKEDAFQEYIDREGHKVICWLDSDSELKKLEQKIKGR
jgi:hypothetical protein